MATNFPRKWILIYPSFGCVKQNLTLNATDAYVKTQGSAALLGLFNERLHTEKFIAIIDEHIKHFMMRSQRKLKEHYASQ